MQQRTRAVLIVALLCIVVTSAALAQTSLNFDGRWNVFASGGQRQSANFALQDALGQPAGAVSTSANSVLQGGFVVGVDAAGEPTVPTVPPGTTPTVPPDTTPPNTVYLPLTIR